MAKEISVRLVNDLSLGQLPNKNRDIKLRELCDRVFELLQNCTSPSGKKLVTILEEVSELHHQAIYDTIYQHLRQNYFHSLSKHKGQKLNEYIIDKGNEFFLADYQSIQNILALFKIRENYKEMPHYLRKKISGRMIHKLFEEEIPRFRVLYTHRKNPMPHKHNFVETIELLDHHYDGAPIPSFIKHIFIHRIFKFQGYSVKIWELMPESVTNPTPVCLIPSFGTNYYSFHCEGNESLDYYLAKNGSRVFILDHEWENQETTMDIYAEYLLTTLIDFVKRRTDLPHVFLMGHSLGGTLVIFREILEAIRNPRFFTSIKGVILINPLINFNTYYYLPFWFIRATEMLVDLVGRKGTIPLKRISQLIGYSPGLPKLLTQEQTLSTDVSDWMEHRVGKYLSKDGVPLQINPFTLNREVLKFLLKRGIVNPPRMVWKHILRMLKSNTEGVVSSDYEELFLSIPEEDTLIEEDLDQHEESAKKTVGLNYTDNLYRVPATIPMLAMHAAHDILSPPKAFLRFWKRWPALHKLRLDSYPNDFENQQSNITKMMAFIEQSQLSVALHVTVHEGRHLDCLLTQKRLMASFIRGIDHLSVSPAEIVHTEVEAFQNWMSKNIDLHQKATLVNDFANKLRFMDPQSKWGHSQYIIVELLKLLLIPIPLPGYDQTYQDLMIRGDEVEQNDELKNHLFLRCIQSIIAFKPDPDFVIDQILELLMNSKNEIHTMGFRAMLGLAIDLYDDYMSQGVGVSEHFLKQLEHLLNFGVKQPERSIALHAVRGFFHTKNADFIQKGVQVYQQLPPEWQEIVYSIYWNEIYKLIREGQNHQADRILENISVFIHHYDQIDQHYQSIET